MNVVILEDAAGDLESGAQFYESCETGVGDYFLDSLLSDLDLSNSFAGVHPIHFGFHRMLSKRFPGGKCALQASCCGWLSPLVRQREHFAQTRLAT